MRAYDEMPPGRFVPFAMLAGPANVRTEVVNTDSHGFRWTVAPDGIQTVERAANFEEVSILIGGSTAFGVGAMSDSTTITSLLSRETRRPWLNFGMRGAVSLQEYVHLIRFVHRFPNVREIVLFSGINDVYINLLHTTASQFDRRFEEQNGVLSLYSLKRQAATLLFARVYGAQPERLVSLPLKEMFFYPLRARPSTAPAPELGLDDQFGVIADIVTRNFFLYAALAAQLGCRLHFILQPFFPWTAKRPSQAEATVFEYLLRLQSGTRWREMLDLMGQSTVRDRVVDVYSNAAAQRGVPFRDSNDEFAGPDTLFVDSVHLSDAGHARAAQVILGALCS